MIGQGNTHSWPPNSTPTSSASGKIAKRACDDERKNKVLYSALYRHVHCLEMLLSRLGTVCGLGFFFVTSKLTDCKGNEIIFIGDQENV